MTQFKKGDKVIIKSTIGSTNEVSVVRAVIDEVTFSCGKTAKNMYILYSGLTMYSGDNLELWNPKKDLNGEYIMKIDMNKKYRTRDGFDVEIIAIRPDLKDGVIGIINGEDFVREWSTDGLYSHDREPCDFDLIESTPYADLKVDDRVLVKNNIDEKWVRRHFAKIIDGEIYVFRKGLSAWTSNNRIERFEQMVKVENMKPDMIIDYEYEEGYVREYC